MRNMVSQASYQAAHADGALGPGVGHASIPDSVQVHATRGADRVAHVAAIRVRQVRILCKSIIK